MKTATANAESVLALCIPQFPYSISIPTSKNYKTGIQAPQNPLRASKHDSKTKAKTLQNTRKKTEKRAVRRRERLTQRQIRPIKRRQINLLLKRNVRPREILRHTRSSRQNGLKSIDNQNQREFRIICHHKADQPPPTHYHSKPSSPRRLPRTPPWQKPHAHNRVSLRTHIFEQFHRARGERYSTHQ
jgi:hypothetical protein